MQPARHLGGETVGCHMIRVLDSAGSTLVEWGRQQQQQQQRPSSHLHFANIDDIYTKE